MATSTIPRKSVNIPHASPEFQGMEPLPFNNLLQREVESLADRLVGFVREQGIIPRGSGLDHRLDDWLKFARSRESYQTLSDREFDDRYRNASTNAVFDPLEGKMVFRRGLGGGALSSAIEEEVTHSLQFFLNPGLRETVRDLAGRYDAAEGGEREEIVRFLNRKDPFTESFVKYAQNPSSAESALNALGRLKKKDERTAFLSDPNNFGLAYIGALKRYYAKFYGEGIVDEALGMVLIGMVPGLEKGGKQRTWSELALEAQKRGGDIVSSMLDSFDHITEGRFKDSVAEVRKTKVLANNYIGIHAAAAARQILGPMTQRSWAVFHSGECEPAVLQMLEYAINQSARTNTGWRIDNAPPQPITPAEILRMRNYAFALVDHPELVAQILGSELWARQVSDTSEKIVAQQAPPNADNTRRQAFSGLLTSIGFDRNLFRSLVHENVDDNALMHTLLNLQSQSVERYDDTICATVGRPEYRQYQTEGAPVVYNSTIIGSLMPAPGDYATSGDNEQLSARTVVAGLLRKYGSELRQLRYGDAVDKPINGISNPENPLDCPLFTDNPGTTSIQNVKAENTKAKRNTLLTKIAADIAGGEFRAVGEALRNRDLAPAKPANPQNPTPQETARINQINANWQASGSNVVNLARQLYVLMQDTQAYADRVGRQLRCSNNYGMGGTSSFILSRQEVNDLYDSLTRTIANGGMEIEPMEQATCDAYVVSPRNLGPYSNYAGFDHVPVMPGICVTCDVDQQRALSVLTEDPYTREFIRNIATAKTNTPGADPVPFALKETANFLGVNITNMNLGGVDPRALADFGRWMESYAKGVIEHVQGNYTEAERHYTQAWHTSRQLQYGNVANLSVVSLNMRGLARKDHADAMPESNRREKRARRAEYIQALANFATANNVQQNPESLAYTSYVNSQLGKNSPLIRNRMLSHAGVQAREAVNLLITQNNVPVAPEHEYMRTCRERAVYFHTASARQNIGSHRKNPQMYLRGSRELDELVVKPIIHAAEWRPDANSGYVLIPNYQGDFIPAFEMKKNMVKAAGRVSTAGEVALQDLTRPTPAHEIEGLYDAYHRAVTRGPRTGLHRLLIGQVGVEARRERGRARTLRNMVNYFNNNPGEENDMLVHPDTNLEVAKLLIEEAGNTRNKEALRNSCVEIARRNIEAGIDKARGAFQTDVHPTLLQALRENIETLRRLHV